MQPKIYFSDQHQIREKSIDPDALFVLEKLQAAGFIAYLVGGGVRDLLLGKKPKDFDISTSARPEQVKKLFRNCLLIGRRFRLAHVRFGRKIIEVATFRAGDTEEADLIVRDNVWGTPEEDVLRRDFTMNGLFYDPSDHSVIDFVGGYDDVQAHLLKMIGEPATRFIQDPVRMIRGIKFRARFGFKLDPAVTAAMEECRDHILNASQARVVEELLRMLESGSAEPFFKLLADHKMIDLLAPGLATELAGDNATAIYEFLSEADDLTNLLKEKGRRLPDRAVLVSALLYPMFEARITEMVALRDKAPNLGEVHDTAWDVINDMLGNGMANLPRRLASIVAYILEAQYRFTPIGDKKIRRQRMAGSPDFLHAVQFLYVRAKLDPTLKETYNSWKELQRQTPPPRRRRR